MAERLVDVLNSHGTVIHTYPVTLDPSGCADDDARFLAKALEAAAYGRLVSIADLPGLSARLHVSRGGPMASYGDDIGVESETKSSLDDATRQRAYLLWKQDGAPDGRADEYWCRAQDQQFRERAYLLWEQEGWPNGRADAHWASVRQFAAE